MNFLDIQVHPPLEKILTATADQALVWIRVGTLFDGNDVIHDAHVVYDSRQIRYVGRAELPPSPYLVGNRGPDAILPEFTLLPGLIEAHAHLFLDGAPVNFDERKKYLEQPADWMLARARQRMEKILRAGVMAVRDAGDRCSVGLTLQNEYRHRPAGRATPYVDSPGAAINRRGRYGGFMSDPVEEHACAETCVKSRIASGAQRIKIIATGIINFDAGAVTTPPQMPVGEVRDLVAAAAAHGKPTFAHASGSEGVEHCVEARVGSIEHGFFVTDDQLSRMRDYGIAWVPTFAPVQLQIDAADQLRWSQKIVDGLKRIIEGHTRSLCRAHQIGVRIIAGSDAGSCGVPHAIGLLTEMELMQKAGMPSQDVIASATGRSSEFLGFPEPIGRIAPGYRPRMILTPHDPLKDVSELRRDKWSLFDGQALRSRNIDSDGL